MRIEFVVTDTLLPVKSTILMTFLLLMEVLFSISTLVEKARTARTLYSNTLPLNKAKPDEYTAYAFLRSFTLGVCDELQYGYSVAKSSNKCPPFNTDTESINDL